MVPVSIPARVQLALDYHQVTDGSKAIVWNRPDGTGELIDWYESIGLWGATAFTTRDGKKGMVFAKKRELLLAQALHHGGVPRPNMLEHVRQLPGMAVIVPVLLSPAAGPDPTLEMLRQHDIQIASDRDPLFVLEYFPPEWLVTLLYEDRSLVVPFMSPELPTVVQVLQTLFSRMHTFEGCGSPGEWEQTQEAEEMPYDVCEQQMRNFKALLGTVYSGLLHTFGEASENEGEHQQPSATLL